MKNITQKRKKIMKAVVIFVAFLMVAGFIAPLVSAVNN